MITLSEESRFLLKNWDRVAELIEARDTCWEELGAYLHSVKDVLRAERWWDGDLVFVPVHDNQCYVSKKEWQDTDGYVIWIGVENFAPDAIFSATSPPSCYLWVQSSRAAEVADALLTYVKRDSELKGLLATGKSERERYVLKKKLRRWYPEELEEFLSGQPLREIADFMGQVYAAIKDYRLPRKGRGWLASGGKSSLLGLPAGSRVVIGNRCCHLERDGRVCREPGQELRELRLQSLKSVPIRGAS